MLVSTCFMWIICPFLFCGLIVVHHQSLSLVSRLKLQWVGRVKSNVVSSVLSYSWLMGVLLLGSSLKCACAFKRTAV